MNALTALPAFQGWRERTARLPRDTRDTLFHLGVLSWSGAPHLMHLPPWCGVMTVLLMLWRARLALKGQALPNRWVIGGVMLLAAGLTWWGERTLLGKEAGITMLVVLMALKTLELRARRDALVVFFLGFFLVLTNFLYSQSLLTGLWLLAAVWGLLTALALAHMPVGRPPLLRAGAVASRAALWGLPIMLLLFVLFPRIGPLWGLPQDAAGRTGLSGTLRLGGVAGLAEDDAIALRVRFFGPVPPPEQQYFRGPVMSTFDGREWTRLVPNFPAAQRPRLELTVRGEGLRYEMTVEPSKLPLLPLLELTPDTEADAPQAEGWLFTLRPDAQWQLDRPVLERLRVNARAFLDHRHGPRQMVPGLRDLLDLPPRANPRTLAWAAALRERAGSADPAVLSALVLQHIRAGDYTYTLEPGPYGTTGDDAIDEFWLDRKLGFCEHYASAYVVVMRAMGVPARIVTGYQGTDAEPQDGYWIVRQRNAHAWAEYWQSGTGWVRVDPTAAVAPDRVRISGRSLAPRPNFVTGAINGISPAVAEGLRRQWEMLNNRWNQWVLSYAKGQQFALMSALGFEEPNWQDLAVMLVLILCGLSLAGAAWAWWDRRRQDPWLRLQARVQQGLQAIGVRVQAHHPPRTRAAMVRRALGPRGEAIAQVLDALDRQRYAVVDAPGASRGPDRAWWRAFQAAIQGHGAP
jgi:transglutaminase-like putative cysteine protease